MPQIIYRHTSARYVSIGLIFDAYDETIWLYKNYLMFFNQPLNYIHSPHCGVSNYYHVNTIANFSLKFKQCNK